MLRLVCVKYCLIVGMLGRYLSNPRMDHRKVAKQVMWYHKEHKDMSSHRGNQIYRRSLVILILLDAKVVGDPHQVYIYLHVRGAISWKSVKQTHIASSTKVWLSLEFI